MTITNKLTFEDYLALDDAAGLPETRCEFVEGALIELPPESEPNNWIANYLFLVFANAKLVSPRLIKPHSCEIQVPVLQLGDAANRYPDLVILQEVHIPLMQRRLTVTMTMPPPILVVEVVSPGKTNRGRDFERKREQYAQLGIPEYWLIDPEQAAVIVLRLETGSHSEVGRFSGSDRILSPTFPQPILTATQIFTAE